MNTLPRAVTAQFFTNRDDFVALRHHWRQLMCSEYRYDLFAAHHLLYLAAIGKDWRAGFTPVTNRRKLANGAYYGWGLFRALALFHSQQHDDWLLTPFDGIISADMLHRIRQLVPKINPYKYQPDDFTPGNFPFEAYTVPSSTYI
jgi:hypothetical protein